MPDDFDILGIENIRALLMGDVRIRERANAEIQWRTPGDPADANVRTCQGYPAVFNQITTLYEGKRYVLQEQISAGAFDDVLADDCHFNYVHESASAMARNGVQGPGGMDLSVDAHGLRVFARLPMDDLDVQRLAPKMDRGVVNQMSFAFSVAEEECHIFTDDQDREVHLYIITKVKRLYDVCVCPLGAYSQTEAMLRSVFAGQLAGRSIEGTPGGQGRAEEAGPEAGDGRADEAGCQYARDRLLLLMQADTHRFQPRKG